MSLPELTPFHDPASVPVLDIIKGQQRLDPLLFSLCDRRPVVASVSSQPSGANFMPAPSPKPEFSSSITSLNARRSTARSPGEAINTWIVRTSGIGGSVTGVSPFLRAMCHCMTCLGPKVALGGRFLALPRLALFERRSRPVVVKGKDR